MSGLAIADEITQYDDQQIAIVSKLSVEGVSDRGIAMAVGIDESELVLLKQDVRFREVAAEFSRGNAERDIGLDDTWSAIEGSALGTLQHDLQYGSEAMTVAEKLAIAKQANAARRRNGVLAESRKGRNGEGIIGDGNVGGNVTTLNVNMPTVMVQRMKDLMGDLGVDKNGTVNGDERGSEVIENSGVLKLAQEQTRIKNFEDTNRSDIGLDDVKSILNVDVANADFKDNSVKLDDVFTGVFEQAGTDSLGFAEGEG